MTGLTSASILQWMVLMAATAEGIPPGLPPAAPDPVLAAVAPAQCVAYVTWSGVAAPDSKSENQTEQLLAEPAIQKLIATAGQALRNAYRAQTKAAADGTPPNDEAVLETILTSISRPGAAFLSKVEFSSNSAPPVLAGGMVFNLGEEAQKVWAVVVKKSTKSDIQKVQIDGSTWYREKPAPDAPEFTTGLKNNYLIVGIGSGEAEKILERMKQEPPKWLTSVRRRLPVERPMVFAFANIKAIVAQASEKGGPQVAGILEALGLNHINAAAYVNGLDATGYTGKMLLGVQGEPTGILDVLKQEPLTAEDLASIPKDAILATVLRLDLDRVWEKSMAIASTINPEGIKRFQGELGVMEGQLGLKVRDDLLKPLGTTWCFSSSPSGSPIPTAFLVVKVRDAKRLAATQEKLVAIAGAMLAARPAAPGRPAPKINRVERDGRTIFVVDLGQPGVPVSPVWCLTDKELVVSLSPDLIQAYLTRVASSGSLADLPEVARLLKSDSPPWAIGYQNTPDVLRSVYPMAQGMLMMYSGQLKQAGVPLDPSMLPPLDTLVKHMRPSIASTHWDKVGLRTTSTSTLPGDNMAAGGGPFGVGVMAGLLLPAIQVARDKARQAGSTNGDK